MNIEARRKIRYSFKRVVLTSYYKNIVNTRVREPMAREPNVTLAESTSVADKFKEVFNAHVFI